ncbi:succinate dehydrogenase iron-sulfur subunit [Carboxydothermus pertinax]|uniref:Fumarate reductase iron-sulfur subunit n=1 Tax=Carboxydothermus pertinax TaxID=870242 RepID=A0A1L8CXF9_9THEO|nr:succinate dehydrogenase iron-sulfur subunit [Carboxydothermus pertinax]GAV23615.1 succinate dehydrogenase iron-sulfur subunit [Carboxydothermus pertinax]
MKVTFKIWRYDPAKDVKPYFQDYTFDVKEGMTVLDCLYYIKENIDATLAFRASCRMGICGSCAMYINKKPRLACETQALSLGTDVIEIAPLPNYKNIKDLVPDLTPLFEKHKNVKPYIIPENEQEFINPTGEYSQTPAELEEYLQFAYCIKCGACLAACPTVGTTPDFPGPQALAQAYRYNADNRDFGEKERKVQVDNPKGLWRCHMAGACAEACPKGVDPALAIQLFKRSFFFTGRKPKARLIPLNKEKPARGGIKAPEPTV